MCDNGFGISLLKNNGSLVPCDVDGKNDSGIMQYYLNCGSPEETVLLEPIKDSFVPFDAKVVDVTKMLYKETGSALKFNPDKIASVKQLADGEKPKDANAEIFAQISFGGEIEVVAKAADGTTKKKKTDTVYLTFKSYKDCSKWLKQNKTELKGTAAVKLFSTVVDTVTKTEPITASFDQRSGIGSAEEFLKKTSSYIVKVTKTNGSVEIIKPESTTLLSSTIEKIGSFKEVVVVSPNYSGEDNPTPPSYMKFTDKESLLAFAGMQSQIKGRKLEVTKLTAVTSDKEGLIKWKVYAAYAGGKAFSPTAKDPYVESIKKSPVSEDIKKNLLNGYSTDGELLNMWSPAGVIVGGGLDIGKFATVTGDLRYAYDFANDLGQGDYAHNFGIALKGGFKPSGFWSKTKAKALEWAIDGLIDLDILNGEVSLEMEPDPVSVSTQTLSLGFDTYLAYLFDIPDTTLAIGPMAGFKMAFPVATWGDTDPDFELGYTFFAGVMLTSKTFDEKTKASADKVADKTEPTVNTIASKFNRPDGIPPGQIAAFEEISNAEGASLDVSFKDVKFIVNTDDFADQAKATAEITKKGEELQKAIEKLNESGLIAGKKVVIKVYGHASPENDEVYNSELSGKRAQKVIDTLKSIIKVPTGVDDPEYIPVPLGENKLYAIELGMGNNNKAPLTDNQLKTKYGNNTSDADIITIDALEDKELPVKSIPKKEAKDAGKPLILSGNKNTHWLFQYDSANWYLVPLAMNRYVTGKATLEFECDTNTSIDYSAVLQKMIVTPEQDVGKSKITANAFEFDTNTASTKIADKKSPITTEEMAALKEVIKANSNAKQELVLFINADAKTDEASTKKLAEWFKVFAGSYTTLDVRVFVTKEERKETGVTMMFTKGTAKIDLADETSADAMEIQKFWFEKTGTIKQGVDASFDVKTK